MMEIFCIFGESRPHGALTIWALEGAELSMVATLNVSAKGRINGTRFQIRNGVRGSGSKQGVLEVAIGYTGDILGDRANQHHRAQFGP